MINRGVRCRESQLIVVDFDALDTLYAHQRALSLQVFHGRCLDSIPQEHLLEHHKLTISFQLVRSVHSLVILHHH